MKTDNLFPDSEVFIKERPTKITPEQEQSFYNEIANEIIDEGWSHSDIEDVIYDIRKICLSDSGYEIAKDLEGFGCKSDYNIDTEFIEFLDNIGWRKRDILESNVKDWVKAHDPQPKYFHGQRLKVVEDLNYNRKSGSIIYVTGFLQDRACYCVSENPDKKGGHVYEYEKIEAKCTTF